MKPTPLAVEYRDVGGLRQGLAPLSEKGKKMGTQADDARDLEEHWEELRSAHNQGKCYPDCPYCELDFEKRRKEMDEKLDDIHEAQEMWEEMNRDRDPDEVEDFWGKLRFPRKEVEEIEP